MRCGQARDLLSRWAVWVIDSPGVWGCDRLLCIGTPALTAWCTCLMRVRKVGERGPSLRAGCRNPSFAAARLLADLRGALHLARRTATLAMHLTGLAIALGIPLAALASSALAPCRPDQRKARKGGPEPPLAFQQGGGWRPRAYPFRRGPTRKSFRQSDPFPAHLLA